MMAYEIDHIFVLTDEGAPCTDALLRFGLTEGEPNRHEGQGTANRRFFFCNSMLELLWVENVEDARSVAARPLQLADRWIGRSVGASPFGICLRPSDARTVLPPFVSYEHRPAFFPEGVVAHIGYGAVVAEPLWFFIAGMRRRNESPSMPYSAPAHRVGINSVTGVTITLPKVPSPLTTLAAAACGAALRTGPKHHLRITFDGGRNGRVHDFGSELPVEFFW